MTNSGAIVTEGPLSDGVYAQSVGGGGGEGGFTVNGTLASGSGGMVSTVGDKGGAGGAGGPVTVTNTGTILVKGAGSVGVFAQSIGGGGEVAGLPARSTCRAARCKTVSAARAAMAATPATSPSPAPAAS